MKRWELVVGVGLLVAGVFLPMVRHRPWFDDLFDDLHGGPPRSLPGWQTASLWDMAQYRPPWVGPPRSLDLRSVEARVWWFNASLGLHGLALRGIGEVAALLAVIVGVAMASMRHRVGMLWVFTWVVATVMVADVWLLHRETLSRLEWARQHFAETDLWAVEGPRLELTVWGWLALFPGLVVLGSGGHRWLVGRSTRTARESGEDGRGVRVAAPKCLTRAGGVETALTCRLNANMKYAMCALVLIALVAGCTQPGTARQEDQRAAPGPQAKVDAEAQFIDVWVSDEVSDEDRQEITRALAFHRPPRHERIPPHHGLRRIHIPSPDPLSWQDVIDLGMMRARELGGDAIVLHDKQHVGTYDCWQDLFDLVGERDALHGGGRWCDCVMRHTVAVVRYDDESRAPPK